MEVVQYIQVMIKDMVPICYNGIKEGLYLIDENGNIWSNYKKDYIKPRKDKNGYLHINLSGGSKSNKKDVRIATLVAWHFNGRPDESIKDPTINHIDSNILNNHYSNLEWIERGKNSSIRKNKGQGSLNHEAILTESQVIEICELLVNTDISLQSIGKKYGVTQSTIANIKNRKTWKNISIKYDFSCRKVIRDKKGKFVSINTNVI